MVWKVELKPWDKLVNKFKQLITKTFLQKFLSISSQRELFEVKFSSFVLRLAGLESSGIFNPRKHSNASKDIEMMLCIKKKFFANKKSNIFFINRGRTF